MSCEYEHWDLEKQKMVHCESPVPDRNSSLCAFHREWVKDCYGLFSRRKGERRTINWLKECKKAYGVKEYNFKADFPLGKPSDAGRDYKFGRMVGA
jgi:hypothetical protein